MRLEKIYFRGGGEATTALTPWPHRKTSATTEPTICAYNNRGPWIVIALLLQLGRDSSREMWRI